VIGHSRGHGSAAHPLSHVEAEALISARLDAPLAPQQEQRLAAHLADCPSCRQFAHQMSAMSSGLRSLPRLPASPTVSRQVRERINQPVSIWERIGGLFGGRVGFAPMAATAAMLALVIAGYALFQGNGDGGHLGPTITAGTQIARNETATRDAGAQVTQTSSSAVTPGRLEPTETPVNAPNVRAADETPTKTPTNTTILATAPSPTPTNTEAPTATDVPTETATVEPTSTTEPTATNTPRPEPTDTPEPTATTTEPTATETATAEPTATEVPTKAPTATETATTEPTATRTPRPQPTATETATAEPTATETPEPTATERPKRKPTRTPEPTATETETPVPVQPTIAPAGGGNAEAPTELPATEIPTEQPTEVIQPGIEPVNGTEVGGETPSPATGTTEITAPTSEATGQGSAGKAPLDDTSRITGITSGGAPVGPLRINAPGDRMVLSSDQSGSNLQVVSMSDGSVLADLGAGADPIWSPLGIVLLYQTHGSGAPAVALYEGDTGANHVISDPATDGAVQDIPAGWSGASAYYLRETGDAESTVILFAYDVNTGNTSEVWRSTGVALSNGRPIPTGDGFLIATTASWLLVGTDGSEQNLGPNDYGLTGEGFLSPNASLVAYPANGQLVIADVSSPGIPQALLPYSGGAGAGFTWSPDGSYVAVSDGAALQIYDAAGNFIGAADSSAGVTIAAPQWLSDGIYYVETSPHPSLRRLLTAKIPGI
jgi:hypothetical protein